MKGRGVRISPNWKTKERKGRSGYGGEDGGGGTAYVAGIRMETGMKG